MIKSKVYFSKSGSGSISGRVTIPKAYMDVLGINEVEKEITMEIEGGRLIIEKVALNKLQGISYDDMVKYVLNNVEYTYNVSKCLNDFIGELGEQGVDEGIFFMTDDQEHFKVKIHHEFIDDDVKYTYDIEKL